MARTFLGSAERCAFLCAVPDALLAASASVSGLLEPGLGRGIDEHFASAAIGVRELRDVMEGRDVLAVLGGNVHSASVVARKRIDAGTES
jgi:hypothetical protein